MGSKMVLCKACGKEIAKSAKKCPHCGKSNINVRQLLIVLVIFGLVFAVLIRELSFTAGLSFGYSQVKELENKEKLDAYWDYLENWLVETYEFDKIKKGFIPHINLDHKGQYSVWKSNFPVDNADLIIYVNNNGIFTEYSFSSSTKKFKSSFEETLEGITDGLEGIEKGMKDIEKDIDSIFK